MSQQKAPTPPPADLVEGKDFIRVPGSDGIVLTLPGLQRLYGHLHAHASQLVPAGAGESVSSVTLTRNAKGGVQPEVKVYDADATAAQRRATEIFDALCLKYPTTNAG